jgi:hypothetical protein
MKHSAADAMITATAAVGRMAGHLLQKPSVGPRGGKPKSKTARKAARRARAITRRG